MSPKSWLVLCWCGVALVCAALHQQYAAPVSPALLCGAHSGLPLWGQGGERRYPARRARDAEPGKTDDAQDPPALCAPVPQREGHEPRG